ncbi:hypothetical protein B7760_05985 (plasmid) [Burkholderia glumae]|nr:hypothetical protein B7760_05985 [Burkholderia glumae]
MLAECLHYLKPTGLHDSRCGSKHCLKFPQLSSFCQLTNFGGKGRMLWRYLRYLFRPVEQIGYSPQFD